MSDIPPPNFFTTDLVGPSSLNVTYDEAATKYAAVLHLAGRQADGGGWHKYFQMEFGIRVGSILTVDDAKDHIMEENRMMLTHYYGQDGFDAIGIAMRDTLNGKPLSRSLAIEDVLGGHHG